MNYYTNPSNGNIYYPTNVWPQSQTQVPVPQTQNTFAWIQGEEAAKNYPVAPGNTVVLIEADKPIMYMKSADLSGRLQPIQVRYLVSGEDYQKIQNGSNSSKSNENYVTKEYFDKKISELDNKFVIKRRDK